MKREELEQIYNKKSEEEKLQDYMLHYEAFNAIQDEANNLALLDGISEQVREGLDRIETLARHRFDFRTEEKKKLREE